MKYLWMIPVSLLLLSQGLAAQPDLSGSWTGIITQNEGGVQPEFDFEIYFRQEGKRITGRSYVRFHDQYAVMELAGFFVTNHRIHFNEFKMVDYTELENLSWCLKSGELQIDTNGETWRLTGPWKGFTREGMPCVPGQIYLKKTVPRA